MARSHPDILIKLITLLPLWCKAWISIKLAALLIASHQRKIVYLFLDLLIFTCKYKLTSMNMPPLPMPIN
jgi:hypothetical protein